MLLVYVFAVLYSFIIMLKPTLSTYKKECLLYNSMLCYASSTLVHPVFTTSLACIIFSYALFNLMFFCAYCSLGTIDYTL